MELKKLPKEEKELKEEEKANLFNSIVLGQDVIETIKTSKGDFKCKYPRMKDIESIGRLTAFRLNGIDAKCFDPNVYALIQEIATLDVLILEGPAWFENAKNEVEGFSFGEIPSQDFIQEIYLKVFQFRAKVQKLLTENKRKTNNRMASKPDVDNSPDTGTFEGLSNKA